MRTIPHATAFLINQVSTSSATVCVCVCVCMCVCVCVYVGILARYLYPTQTWHYIHVFCNLYSLDYTPSKQSTVILSKDSSILTDSLYLSTVTPPVGGLDG